MVKYFECIDFEKKVCIAAPLSLAEATQNYIPSKKNKDHLEFYKGEKIKIFGRYVTPPFNKFWLGEVIGVKVSKPCFVLHKFSTSILILNLLEY